MPRQASLSGFKQQFTPTYFEDLAFKMEPSAEGLTITDKTTKKVTMVPARYIIALEKVGKSVKVMYEEANTPSEEVETPTVNDDELQTLLAS
jgi:hypothetical protein